MLVELNKTSLGKESVPVMGAAVFISIWIHLRHHIEVILTENVTVTTRIFKQLMYDVRNTCRTDPFSSML